MTPDRSLPGLRPRTLVVILAVSWGAAGFAACGGTGDPADPGVGQPLATPSGGAGAEAGDDAAGDEAANPRAPGDGEAARDGGPDAFASCPAGRPDAGTLPADVEAVLVDKCQSCHKSPLEHGVPFTLRSYADTQVIDPLPDYAGLPIWQVMHTVIQPDGVPHMPYGTAPQLTSAEMATLDAWLIGCALPAGAEASVEAAPDD